MKLYLSLHICRSVCQVHVKHYYYYYYYYYYYGKDTGDNFYIYSMHPVVLHIVPLYYNRRHTTTAENRSILLRL
jgi:hypothetical protein